MRSARSGVVVALTLALLVLPVAVAQGVGEGNPVIQSPTASTKLYAGFTGPFIVDLDDAPIATYSYWVTKVPSGGGTPVLVGPVRQEPFNGSFPRPELRVSALGPGTGYTFHISDGDGHEASLGFAVSSDPPPRCAIVLPRAVRMKGRSAVVPARLSSTCKTLKTTYASWEARHPRVGFANTFSFFSAKPQTWRIYDDEYPGVYTVRPNSAKNSANEPVLQNTTRVTMRMDARLRFTAARSGKSVTLRTASSRYAPNLNRYVTWGKRKVVFSYRTCTACAWKRLAVRTGSRTGVAGVTVRAPGARQYRATAAGTTTVWAPLPRYVRR